MNDITNYNSMHRRIAQERGSAKLYLCIDCKERNAHHWSLRHGADYTVQVGTKWEGRMFSTNVEDYEPRCGKCHSAHDRAHGLTKGPSGVKFSHPERPTCTIGDCDKPNKAHGRCDTHYAALRREQKRETMKVVDCRSLEQIAADQTMEDFWTNIMTGADPEKVLGKIIYAAKKLRKELQEDEL